MTSTCATNISSSSSSGRGDHLHERHTSTSTSTCNHRKTRSAVSSSQSSVESLVSRIPKASTSSSTSSPPVPKQQQLKKYHWGSHYLDVNSSTNNGPNNNNNNKSSSSSKSSTASRRNQAALRGGRVLVVFVLLFVASMLGFVAYTILTQDEQELAKAQFRSVSQRALLEVQSVLRSRRDAGVAMAQMLAELHPNATQWPFVPFWGFERLARSLLQTARGRDMGYVPYLFDPEAQAHDFEVFARQVYQELGFVNETEAQHLGLWASNASTTPPTVYHDTTGEADWDSPYKILTPVFRTDAGFNNIRLYNAHSKPSTGASIDRVIACSKKRQLLQEHAMNTTGQPLPPEQDISCGVMTDLFPVVKFQRRWGAAHFYPVYPLDDPYTVVGHISTLFAVEELLENTFAPEVSGIDACFVTFDQSVTFTIRHGVAYFVGEGKLHDPKYESEQQSAELLDPSLYTDAPLSVQVILTPNKDFYAVYETNNPAYVSIGAVCTILVTSLVFFLYDFLVRREFHAKRELLEARRQFMRFVSHEVRTPLNAVSMGLDLMQSELAQALGYESATSLRASRTLVEDPSSIAGKSGCLDSCGRRGQDKEAQLRDDLSNTSNHKKNDSRDNNNNNPTHSCLSSQRALEWFQLTQEIQGNTQGAVDILNDILNYDKLEQGTLQLATEVISVWELLEAAILEFKLSASSKQVKLGISFEYDEDSEEIDDEDIESHHLTRLSRAQELPQSVAALKVIGDSIRLTQVIRNLMSNALKFTPPKGSVQVTASYVPPEPTTINVMDQSTKSTSAAESDHRQIKLDKGDVVSALPEGYMRVRVTDTGAGMTKEQLSKLFRDGVQFNANELQSGGGSGLGLFIAKGIVTQHKGVLFATSEGIGHGTTFEMTLPLWQVAQEDELGQSTLYTNPDNLQIPVDIEAGGESSTNIKVEESPNVTTSTTTAPAVAPESAPPLSLRILIVDDVTSNRKLLKRLLERNGHQCEEADNGQVAVEMVEQAASHQTPYDSILLDFEMPVMDGPAAAKEMRRLGHEKLIIVGITGNVLPEDVVHFRACGANDVLAKPVKMPDLYASWRGNGVAVRAKLV